MIEARDLTKLYGGNSHSGEYDGLIASHAG